MGHCLYKPILNNKARGVFTVLRGFAFDSAFFLVDQALGNR